MHALPWRTGAVAALRALSDSFYLAIAAGGAIGGVFVALVAPRIFSEFSEYPIGLAAACLLDFLGWLRSGALRQWTTRNFAVRIPLMALLFGGLTAIVAAFTNGNQPTVASARNFYGILRVTERSDSNGSYRELRHGRTRHGFQYLKDPQRSWPTSYYGPHSGVAIALNALDQSPRKVAVIGLGAGTLAAWGRPGDTFRFYEINPGCGNNRADVVFVPEGLQGADSNRAGRRAGGTGARTRGARWTTIRSDRSGRVFERRHSGPSAHAECADIYRRRLAPGGLLLLHISNRVLDLEPVARGMAQYLGWTGGSVYFRRRFRDRREQLAMGADDGQYGVAGANRNGAATFGLGKREPILWTDDFASLWHVLRF